MPCQRATEVRKVLEAVEVLDSYGFTTAAQIAALAAEDILDGRVDHAPKASDDRAT